MSDANAVAIVGMAGRFPGADDTEQLWRNLRDGVDSIRRLDEAELAALGVSEQTRRDPNFVPSAAVLSDPEYFDAEFFGVQPREAAHTDPQHRVFLETVWHAMEDAGYDPKGTGGTVGVYGGATLNSYLLFNLLPGRTTGPSVFEGLQLGALNSGDFLTSRVAYKLGFTGPTQTVQTACSSSLVAVHNAAQSLLLGECDTAVAGGVSVQVHHRGGYHYTPDSAASPDGACRVFDERGAGTVFGSGCAVVVLRRLEDALADDDRIRAVIRGSAVNNDGADKAGFTAPGVAGQARVIAQALANAEVSADTVEYVEAHGTGTRLGDPIEVRALTKAFRAHTTRRSYCALGSVKGNVGHLDAAAGVAGLIKAVFALEHGEIPPVVHFTRANPELGLPDTPFYVNAEPRPWPRGQTPRRAGVSSFGIGGTNAHVVLEEAPPVEAPAPASGWQVVVASTRTPAALDQLSARIGDRLRDAEAGEFADLAYTSQTGRHAFAHRRFAVGRDAGSTARALAEADPVRTGSGVAGAAETGFLFPGMGPHYNGMATGLYRDEPVFRQHADECADLLLPLLGADLREVVFRAGADGWADEPRLSLPATFTVNYSLARLLMHAGVRPRAMLGHSVGEYVAACLAGVFGLPDALKLVAARGAIFSELSGEMLTVSLSERDLVPLLGEGLSLAAVNADDACAVSGHTEAVRALAARLAERGVAHRPLPFPAAAHSALIEPELPRFREVLTGVRFHAPEVPFVSNLTGTWAGDEVANPDYWVRHLRETVRFADGLRTLGEVAPVLAESGPGQTLSRLARLTLAEREPVVVPVMRHRDDRREDAECLAAALGRLWVSGVGVDWRARHAGEVRRRRAALPGYPFQREKHWIEPATATVVPAVPVVPEPAPPAATSAPVTAPDRTTEVADRIAGIMGRVSGLPADRIDRGTNLFQLGFDSVALVEAGMAINEHYGTEIPVREMFEQLSTVDELAAHIASGLPPLPAPVAAPAPAPPAPPVAQLPAGGAPDLASVVAQQIEAMWRQNELQHEVFAQQLAALAGTPASAGNPAPPPASAAPEPERLPAIPSLMPEAPPLTPSQQAYLDRFVRRYLARTGGSRARTERSRLLRANFRNRENLRPDLKELVYPIFAEHGRGGRITDVDGNTYVDLTMGFGALLLGHGAEFIDRAVLDELSTGQGMMIGPCTSHAEDVAQLISRLTGAERVAFFTSGTHAVMVAVRLARAATGRRRIVVFSGSFHGTYDATLVRRDLLGAQEGALPVGPGIPAGATADVLVVDYCKPAALETIRAHAHELAAVVVEPVQSRTPGLDPGPFLTELREITSASGTALVFDEMVTGFRLHPGGAQALFGVEADLVTYGKVAGGGMPLGVVAGKAEYLDGVDGGQWNYGDDSMPSNDARRTITGGTFCEHPLAMVAAKAILSHFAEAGPGLQQRLNDRGDAFAARLREVVEAEAAPVTVTNFGSIVRMTVPAELELFYYHLIDKGVYLWEGRTLFLSTAHTDADLDLVVEAVRETLRELRAHGFLPGPEALPLTDEQQQMWAHAELGADAAVVFHDSAVVSISGELDVPALRSAVGDVVARHDALRTGVSEVDGEPVQLVRPSVRIDVPVLDWRDGGEDLGGWLEREVRRPFDRARPPLMRVTLIRTGETGYELVVLAHHLVLDGWSWNVVLQDLFGGYLRRRGVVPPGPLADPVPTRDFLDWRRERLDGPAGAAALEHWRRVLADPPPPLTLPPSRIAAAGRVHAARRHQEHVDARLRTRLTELARERRATLPMVLFGAFTLLLHRLTGQTDLVFELPTAGQLAMGAPELVGCCDNVLPVRIGVDPSTSFTEHLALVRGALGTVYEHQGVSFAGLVTAADAAGAPLPSWASTVLFNVDKPVTIPSMDGLRLAVRPGPMLSARQELGLNAVDVGGELRLDFDHDAELFDQDVCRSWFESYVDLLRAVADRPDAPLADLAAPVPPIGTNPVPVTGIPGLAGDPDRVVAEFPDGPLTVRELAEADGSPDAVPSSRRFGLAVLAAARAGTVPSWWPDRRTWPELAANAAAVTTALGLPGDGVHALCTGDPALVAERLLGALGHGHRLAVVDCSDGPDPVELRKRVAATGADTVELPLGFAAPADGALPVDRLILTGDPADPEHGAERGFPANHVLRAHRSGSLGLTIAVRTTAGNGTVPTLPVDRPVRALTLPGVEPGVPAELRISLPDGEIGTGLRGVRYPGGRIALSGPEAVVRGRTVFLPALTAVLAAVPGVAEAEVTTRLLPDRLVALVVPAGGTAEPADLTRRCREAIAAALPEGYLPHRIAVVPELPRDWAGALVPGELELPAPEPDHDDPVSRQVAAIWSEVLETGPTDPADTLFDHGGTSLLAARLVSKLELEFGVRLALRDVFTHPTVAGLAELVRSGGGTRRPTGEPELVRLPREAAEFELSFAQRRLWYVEQLGGGASYVVFFGARLNGPLDREALHRALTAVIARHETLRTRFTERDGVPAQIVLPAGEADLPVTDLTTLGEAERESEVQRLARDEQDTPFDLDSGEPLLRTRLLALAPDRHVLLIAAHHIICDGWSFDVLLRDTAAEYVAATSGGRADSLPELPVQYVDYADWQRRWLDGPGLRRQLDHWRETLGSPPVQFELETDRPRPPVQTFAGAVHRVDLPPDVVRALRALGRAEGTSLFVVLLAVFQALLAGVTGQRDVVVATPSANRRGWRTEQLIGFFVNMLVIRTGFTDRPAFRAVVARVADAVLAADANQDVPFDLVVDELLEGREPSRPPLASVMFLMDTVSGNLRAGDLELARLRVDWATAKYDLSLLVDNVDDDCHCVFEYNSDLFEPETVELLARRFVVFATGLAADPEARL